MSRSRASLAGGLFLLLLFLANNCDKVHGQRFLNRVLQAGREQRYHVHMTHFLVASESLTQTSTLISKWKQRKERRRPHSIQTPPTVKQNKVDKQLPVNIVVGINAAVLCVWHVSAHFGERASKCMQSNFLLFSDKKIQAKKPHSFLTSAFSHIEISHFANNMIVFQTFAPAVVEMLGYRKFSYFYIASAYGSQVLKNFFTHPTADQTKKNKIFQILFSEQETLTASLGASGCVSALIVFHCLSLPAQIFYVGGMKLKAPLAALIWAVEELVHLVQDDDCIGHGAHLGGYLFGLIAWIAHTAWEEGSILAPFRKIPCKKWYKGVAEICRHSKDILLEFIRELADALQECLLEPIQQLVDDVLLE